MGKRAKEGVSSQVFGFSVLGGARDPRGLRAGTPPRKNCRGCVSVQKYEVGSGTGTGT